MRLENFLKYQDEIIALRRDFHMHPELGFEEFRTSGIVRDYLGDLGIETVSMAKTGVVGYLNNGGEVTVGIRADMDALPIQEENEVPYKSRVPGKMHACGHDAHTAMLLVTAKILSGMEFDGNVRFIFQPAEEGLNGAAKMVEEGAIEGVDRIIGMHVWVNLPSKSIGISPGPILAAVDRFKIKVLGKGGHGASPHETADPIVASAQIISSMQSVVSRNVDPVDTAVLTVGSIHGGSAFNVIPESVEMDGTVRTFKDGTQRLVERRIGEICTNVARAYGCEANLEYMHLNYATVNEERMAEIGRQVASFTQVLDQGINMGGEDFSEYARRIPGLFAYLGVRNEEKGITNPHHSPKFDIDESALPYGVAFEVLMALELMKDRNIG
ncbi:amidohydrolase [Aciduliprofundum sp. MAR08-339]|uniref:M20 metallopeptidase family protein n=1 Tax=Aciduliprofundum sp. (strain MAR08-339) TaxID=673860 RepID=UPI0002A4A8FA|nr:amidohydrolase [Aciduliprofundum sp. MAR08-339]